MLQAPLEELWFEYNPHGDAPFDGMLEPDELRQYHPLFLCQNFAASLRDLGCRFASPHCTGFTYPQLPVYPNLRYLTLQDDWPVLRPWIASCPNLTVLSSTTHHEAWVAEDADDDEDINPEWEEVRQRNLDD